MTDKESNMAYEQGFKDGYDGKPTADASDVYGPYNSDYYAGYQEGMKRADSVIDILNSTW